MVEHEVRYALVVDPRSGRPVGVLSTLDLAAILAGRSKLNTMQSARPGGWAEDSERRYQGTGWLRPRRAERMMSWGGWTIST
jgi:hypothetical protein